MKLPDYKGSLGPTSWSEIKPEALTQEAKKALAEAALRGCPVCRKQGYLEDGTKIQICHCVNRSEDRT